MRAFESPAYPTQALTVCYTFMDSRLFRGIKIEALSFGPNGPSNNKQGCISGPVAGEEKLDVIASSLVAA